MSSMLQSFQKGRSLPVSHSSNAQEPSAAAGGGMRRRVLSSMSLPSTTTSAATAWALRRSKSVSSASTSIRNWCAWGWTWILSTKPVFAQDLEMNQEETSALGCHNKGSWSHVFYKLRSQIRNLIGSDQVDLPRYNCNANSHYVS